MHVVEVNSITSPAGWAFPEGEPVACFALVTFSDPEDDPLYKEQLVVPLGQADLGRNLIGLTLEDFEWDAVFVGTD